MASALSNRRFHDGRVASPLVLFITRGESPYIEVREQPLDLPIVQRGTLDAG